ncbi:MAG: amino acid/amide transporter substrate-binding protein family, partial [Proteobacteria bacterium]|nr:amino acid/amide transporter substrate-binding protein family [Pseudomonadota bacterium]
TSGTFNMSATDHMGLDLSAFRMLEVKGGDWSIVQ